MDLSIYLAKVIGLYFFIVSFGMLANKKKLQRIVLDLLKNAPLLFVTGFLALIIGLLLVTSHNVWVMDWPVIITIIGWLSLTKGIIRVAFPHLAVKTSQKWIESEVFYYTTFIIMTFIGLVLMYLGYARLPS